MILPSNRATAIASNLTLLSPYRYQVIVLIEKIQYLVLAQWQVQGRQFSVTMPAALWLCSPVATVSLPNNVSLVVFSEHEAFVTSVFYTVSWPLALHFLVRRETASTLAPRTPEATWTVGKDFCLCILECSKEVKAFLQGKMLLIPLRPHPVQVALAVWRPVHLAFINQWYF